MMNTTKNTKTLVMTALIAAFSLANAADKTVAAPASPMQESTTVAVNEKDSWMDSLRVGAYGDEKDVLEKMLTGATSVEELRDRLTQAGYIVTSINEESEDELEYEVVKAGHSFEVKAEMEGEALTEIDVDDNLWRAEETKRAMSDASYKPANVMYDEENPRRYSDSQYKENWNQEKEVLEAALPKGKTVDEYQKILQDQGYQITSMNETDSDKVEFEIVKGKQSYEVQFGRDSATKLVDDIDVTTNMWQSKETERALGQE